MGAEIGEKVEIYREKENAEIREILWEREREMKAMANTVTKSKMFFPFWTVECSISMLIRSTASSVHSTTHFSASIVFLVLPSFFHVLLQHFAPLPIPSCFLSLDSLCKQQFEIFQFPKQRIDSPIQPRNLNRWKHDNVAVKKKKKIYIRNRWKNSFFFFFLGNK